MTTWLHAGSAKTGTASLQRTLSASRSALKRHGIEYPAAREGHNHKEIVDAAQKGIRQLENVLDEYAVGQSVTVVSSEHVELLSREQKSSLVETLEKRFGPVRLLIYLRDPVSFAVSATQQEIKMRTKTFEEACENPRLWNYRRHLEDWLEILGRQRLLVRKYDRDSLVNGDLVDDALHVMGCDFLRAEMKRKQANESMSMAAALALSDFTRARRKGKAIAVPVETLMARLGSGPKFTLPAVTKGFVRGAQRENIVWVRNTFGIDFGTELQPGDWQDPSIRQLSRSYYENVGLGDVSSALTNEEAPAGEHSRARAGKVAEGVRRRLRSLRGRGQ